MNKHTCALTAPSCNKCCFSSGYMSLEYAMHGQFSEKSDVYSFGVLVLEIISGKKNKSFNVSGYDKDLLSHVSLKQIYSPLQILKLLIQARRKNIT